MNIKDRITSMKDMVGDSVRQYIKPPPEKMEQFKVDLFDSVDALNYLKVERGFAEDTIKHFNLGYDKTKNAIAIPIFKNKELINIRYRLIAPAERQSKYIQEKDCEVWLYNEEGIDIALKRGRVLVVEGEFDCMSAWQAGTKNVVSPASGKDSYGVWLELLDNIPEVYIAYDNDKPGKDASYKFAERIGIEKSKEISYPEGIKDANEFFQKKTYEDFKEMVANARPFYTRKYNDLYDIVNFMRSDTEDKLEIDILPDVKLTPDHLVSIAGGTNSGKTLYALNIAKKLAEKGIPTLVLPYERGIQTVGARFIQVLLGKNEEEIRKLSADEWDKLLRKVANTPVYFSVPKKEEFSELIVKAKRILGIRALVIDHLDYMVRGDKDKEESAIRTTMHEIKALAIEHEIMMFVVTHTRRVHQAGGERHKKPTMHDIRGSTAIEQDSETVVMIDKDDDITMQIDVQKNKGKMTNRFFSVNYETGIMGDSIDRATSLDDF